MENNNMSNEELLAELKRLREQVINSSHNQDDDNNYEANKNGDSYGFAKRKSISNGGQKYFGNQDNGFASALILGVIVFLTETLFLVIGYFLFR